MKVLSGVRCFRGGILLSFLAVLCTTSVLLSTAKLSSISDFIQRSTSVTETPNQKATNNSPGANNLGVYRSTSLRVSSVKERPTYAATNNATDAKEKPKRTAISDASDAKRLGVFRSPLPKYANIKDLPVPLQVVEQYKRWHSVDNLIRNDTVGRKYAMAFYRCPMEAGNRMHHFFNDFLWAILTNRTILWKYYDRETCLKYGKLYSKGTCLSANTVDDCNEILLRAPWIPSYDEWSEKLNLAEPFEFPYRSTHPKSLSDADFPWNDGDEKHYEPDNEEKYPHQVAAFAQNRFKFFSLQDESIRNEMLGTSWARECAAQLYSLGTNFLFGMLHRSAFDFTKPVRASAGTLDSKNAVSVALHSRHIYDEVDGCNIARETKCMQKMIGYARGRSINVGLMSDRECTISRLTTWLQKRNISVLVAKHDEDKGPHAEHGPFAGVGFFQDLALVTTARSAFVAMERSSSNLMRELIVFYRKLDAWIAGEDVMTANAKVCMMDYNYDSALNSVEQSTGRSAVASVKEKPSITTTNYSYDVNRLGVYRPPVANYSILSELPLPLQVIEQYKQWHSVDTLRRNDTVGRKYALAFYQCPLTAGNRMHHFLNDFLWAVLTNRTMLWKYYDRETCLKYGRHYSKEICRSANTANDCGEILLRAPWIPSYDEWAPKLELAEPYEFPFRSTHPKYIVEEKFPWTDGDEKHYGADNTTKYPHQVAAFQQNRYRFGALEHEGMRNKMLATVGARACAKNLYSLGTDFLNGMLHRSAFDFSKHIRANEGILDNKNAVSVTVHSRHIYTEVDGCNVVRETNCMRTIIQNAHGRSVNVRLMSDRACTISRLTTWLGKRNISVAVAQHDESKDNFDEHGPFAGTGFYQDLALASTARSAVVAMIRSSSYLMIELVVFNRKMDAWAAGEDVMAANVELCFMDYKYNATPSSISQTSIK